MKKERFYSPEIIKDKEASIKHFKPEAGGRDRFGNRIFTSPDLAYIDRTGDKVKAGLLVSPEGEEFMLNNKGILKDIEYGLTELENPNRDKREKGVDIGVGKYMELLARGGQSNVYLLTINGKKYVIKTHRTKRYDNQTLHQPYINEMLQTQAVARDLERALSYFKVHMNTFLFASGQVSCTKYEATPIQKNQMDMNKFYNLDTTITNYIKKQQNSQNSLWSGVDIDMPPDPKDRRDAILNNFKSRLDGTLVWIDPFLSLDRSKFMI